jgi:hypothetical protein
MIGYFKEGAREGRGKYKWNDNSYYEGEWKGDKMHGRGKYGAADGVVTEGFFEDDNLISLDEFYSSIN